MRIIWQFGKSKKKEPTDCTWVNRVREKCLAQAVAVLTTGRRKKDSISAEDVITAARVFEAYVLGES